MDANIPIQNCIGVESFILSDNTTVSVKKYSLEFSEWKGAPIRSTYNGKAVVDSDGEPLYAELAVAKLFRQHGWSSVWMNHTKVRVGLPENTDPITLPKAQQDLIHSIRLKLGTTAGCWDVLAWKDGLTLFIELKRGKKDKIQQSQINWLEQCLKSGFTADQFLLVEWTLV